MANVKTGTCPNCGGKTKHQDDVKGNVLVCQDCGMASSENELADPRTEAVQIPVDSPEHEDAPSGTDENPVHIIAYQYGDEDPTATAQEKVAAKETAAAES